MRLRLLLAVAAASLALAGCSSSDENQATVKEPEKVDGVELSVISPLTGQEFSSKPPANPVYVVKIDNTPPAAPQRNINKADLVVEELVEGGMTRLAALFHSELPDVVGHVRSLRTTDIGIAKPVDGVIVASGGAGGAIGRIKDAKVRLLTEDAGDPGFSSDVGSRPYNRLVDMTQLKAKTTSITRPYFNFTGEAAASDVTAKTARVTFSRTHATSWGLKDGTWTRTNGHGGDQEFAANSLVVLFADEKDAGYRDPAGNPVPETVFEGSGRAVVFAADKVVEGKWKKKSAASTITLTDEAGSEFSIPPGKVWIELVTKTQGNVSWE